MGMEVMTMLAYDVKALRDNYGIPVVGPGLGTGLGGALMAAVTDNVIGGLYCDSEVPTPDESIQLKSYIQYVAKKCTGDANETISAGHNTAVFRKHPKYGWQYRRMTWESGPLFAPNVEDGKGLSLADCLDLAETISDTISSSWVEWKSKYPKGYTMEVRDERYQIYHSTLGETLQTKKAVMTFLPPNHGTIAITVHGSSKEDATLRATRLKALTDLCVGATPEMIEKKEIHLRRRVPAYPKNGWTERQAQWWAKTIMALFGKKSYCHCESMEMRRFVPEVRTGQIIDSVTAYQVGDKWEVSIHDTYGSHFVKQGIDIDADKKTLSYESNAPCGDNTICVAYALENIQEMSDTAYSAWRQASEDAGFVEQGHLPDDYAAIYNDNHIYFGTLAILQKYKHELFHITSPKKATESKHTGWIFDFNGLTAPDPSQKCCFMNDLDDRGAKRDIIFTTLPKCDAAAATKMQQSLVAAGFTISTRAYKAL